MKRNSLKSFALVGAVLFVAARVDAADILWIGGTGVWNAAPNWVPAQIPGAADNAFITNNGIYTVSIPNSVDATVASLTLGGISGSQTLSLGRSILTLNGPSVVNASGQLLLTVANSTITGTGNLTVNGTLSWASGTMSGAGVTSVGTGGVMTINGGVTLTARTLNNGGHVSWDSGNFTAGSGAVINNLAGATFDITFDGRLDTAAAPATFNNFGLLRKTAGTTTANLILPFQNSGMMQTQAGTLSLDGGGTHTGIFSNAPAATANFGGGSHALGSGSFVTGAGVLAVSGNGTLVNANGPFDAGAALNVTAGVTTLASGANVTGATVSVGGGVLNFNSAGPVGVLNLGAGTLGGISPVNVTGPLTLSGGAITNALVIANGGLNIIGGVTLNGGKLINPATARWSAGNFTGANGAVFSNLSGATFINTFDGNAPSGAGVTPTFVNAGLFQKTNGTAALGTTSIDFQFINSGVVEVRTNTLRYALNQQIAGRTLLDGGALAAQAQPVQILGGSLVGTGLVTVGNVQNVINSSAISPGLPLGQLDIAGNYQQTASGTLNIDLGGYSAGQTYDRVTVAAGGVGGVATLGGTLNIALTNGFSPTNGATFRFLTANSRVGAFTTFNYPSNDIGLQIDYDLTSARVTVSNLKPIVANPMPDPPPVTYGSAFHFQFADNTFLDPDNNSLTYTASGMPPGITFAGATRTFSGQPSQAGVFTLTVTAHDDGLPNLTGTNSFRLTVSPAALTIVALPKSKIYGSTVTLDGATDFTSTGLLNGEAIGSVTLTASGSPAGTAATAAAGEYTITSGAATGGTFNSANYAITYAPGTLTVNKAALFVTPLPNSKVFGAADPAFTASYSGFVNGETPAVLGGSLSFVRSSGESVGSYLLTPLGLTASNYTLTFNPSTLTITPPAPRILSLTGAGTANALITWSAVSNGVYRVQSKADLSTTSWTEMVGDVTATSSTASKTDTRVGPHQFYRIRVVP